MDDDPDAPNITFLQVGGPTLMEKKTISHSVRNVFGKMLKKPKSNTHRKTSELQHIQNEGDKEFYSVFNIDKSTRRRTVLQSIAMEEKKKRINLRNLPKMSDKEAMDFTSQELVGRLIESKYFRFTIMALIFLTFILTAFETDKEWEREHHAVFETLDQIITTIFVCEVILKWFHGFWKFWRNGFNILDFFIVFSLLVGPMVLSSSSNKIIRILRVLRVFRSLREISSIPRLQVIVQAIIQSVPDMAHIVLLLVIFMLVFSVVGINGFGERVPNFRNLSAAMFSLFICITQDGWVDILAEFEKQDNEMYVFGSLYLIIFIILGAFIFTNLIVAVVVTNLEYAVKDVKNEESQQMKDMGLKPTNENEDSDAEVDTIYDDDIPQKIFEHQEPFNIPDLSGLDIRTIENYLLIVSAMEENIRVYKKIKAELREIFNQACEINKSAAMEGVVDADPQDRRGSVGDAASLIELNKDLAKLYKRRKSSGGDMLSSLMNMEHSQLVDSSTKNSLGSVMAEVADSQMTGKLENIDREVQMRYYRRRSTSRSLRKMSSGERRRLKEEKEENERREKFRSRRMTLTERRSLRPEY